MTSRYRSLFVALATALPICAARPEDLHPAWSALTITAEQQLAAAAIG
jgi:hypothetical protein